MFFLLVFQSTLLPNICSFFRPHFAFKQTALNQCGRDICFFPRRFCNPPPPSKWELDLIRQLQSNEWTNLFFLGFVWITSHHTERNDDVWRCCWRWCDYSQTRVYCVGGYARIGNMKWVPTTIQYKWRVYSQILGLMSDVCWWMDELSPTSSWFKSSVGVGGFAENYRMCLFNWFGVYFRVGSETNGKEMIYYWNYLV